ncbi:MAG: hypothetical protein AAFQ80_08115 [Cyanobacteria bacterium J06621_8]
MYPYIIGIAADLRWQESVDYNLGLTNFHNFIGSNQAILRYIELFDFGLIDGLAEGSDQYFRLMENKQLNSNSMLKLAFFEFLFIHCPYLAWLNEGTDARLSVFKERLVNLLILKIDDKSN